MTTHRATLGLSVRLELRGLRPVDDTGALVTALEEAVMGLEVCAGPMRTLYEVTAAEHDGNLFTIKEGGTR